VRRAHRLLPIVALVAAVAAACLAPARAGDDDRSRLSAWKDGRLDVPRGLPSPGVPPSNPVTDAKLALGRRLFFDRTLSRDGTKGCVDCHAPEKGYGDGLATAVGVRGQVGPRNVPSLLNAAIYPALFWDGRAVSLEAQAEARCSPHQARHDRGPARRADRVVRRTRRSSSRVRSRRSRCGASATRSRRSSTLARGRQPVRPLLVRRRSRRLSPAAAWARPLRRQGRLRLLPHRRPSDAAFTDFGFHATGTVRKAPPTSAAPWSRATTPTAAASAPPR
jgi:cytochrome c peroxidase